MHQKTFFCKGEKDAVGISWLFEGHQNSIMSTQKNTQIDAHLNSPWGEPIFQFAIFQKLSSNISDRWPNHMKKIMKLTPWVLSFSCGFRQRSSGPFEGFGLVSFDRDLREGVEKGNVDASSGGEIKPIEDRYKYTKPI